MVKRQNPWTALQHRSLGATIPPESGRLWPLISPRTVRGSQPGPRVTATGTLTAVCGLVKDVGSGVTWPECARVPRSGPRDLLVPSLSGTVAVPIPKGCSED